MEHKRTAQNMSNPSDKERTKCQCTIKHQYKLLSACFGNVRNGMVSKVSCLLLVMISVSDHHSSVVVVISQ